MRERATFVGAMQHADLEFASRQCVALVGQQFDRSLNGTLDSLDVLDTVCDELLAAGPLTAERLNLWMQLLGAYVGEVLVGVYGGEADPLPMMTLFDKQVQLRMGQANVLRWVPEILPLLTDDDPLGVDTFASHRLPLEQAPQAYEKFQKKEDGYVKVVLQP